ncbi:Protein N-acetyltransferase, RimJ/RimL family [Streptoalloteichus tenebrarius]|uniref:Protein N-acetyltransferase, RimJ/RimL family n=1 Tax=Streptoalloteichus tenebrarius (strain ATCC 17920 / DSM 40477 / JCM 4838 / CBS 697.72 / NBRC 16177 / NCIMB 11028 / NRRL B-12390 / A12253. 1 / ISP 5477) TaxID=1933 RepID=A0ABT1HUJ4_STRSD|nr:GNAT family protein [Streptoalloteichus tenebrarius]MCP2259189.1 Protein N-acetyltransferase, RimJ/RimL family [Streptoalloteichus tenebrarius]BFF04330.1 GNAT family protein [Streptoalloteichus tenebrarius]
MTSIWTGSKVRLRGIEPEDWPAFQRFDDHTADMRTVDRVYPPRSAAGYRQWAAEEATRAPDGDEFRLAVESLSERVVVGALSTTGADRRAGRFGHGIGIGREHQRRGYATDAVVVLLTSMFGELRYHRCEVSALAFNEASIAPHRKIGFRVEGRLRDHEYCAGRHHDVVLLGITADEFAERHPYAPL